MLADPEGNELCVFPSGQGAPDALVVDSADPEGDAAWWADVLGASAVVAPGGLRRWLADVPGLPWEVWKFVGVDDPKTVKNRWHWDVVSEDVDELVRRGATLLRGPDDVIDWHVLADPAGNEFCVFAPDRVRLVTALDLSLSGPDLTVALCDVESVSGNETALADLLERALRDVPHLTVDRDGDAVVARTSLGRAERVVLAGHIDTVPLGGNLPCRVEGGRIHGCGTTDMKSGVAVQLRLAAHLPRAQPRRDLRLLRPRGGRGRQERPRPDRAQQPRLAGRRLRGADGADQRDRRGRLPGHACAPTSCCAATGRTRPGRGWARTRCTRRARCCAGWRRTTRSRSRSTAWSTARGSTRSASAGEWPATSSRTSAG